MLWAAAGLLALHSAIAGVHQKPMQLPSSIHEKIVSLSKNGDALVRQGKYRMPWRNISRPSTCRPGPGRSG